MSVRLTVSQLYAYIHTYKLYHLHAHTHILSHFLFPAVSQGFPLLLKNRFFSVCYVFIKHISPHLRDSFRCTICHMIKDSFGYLVLSQKTALYWYFSSHVSMQLLIFWVCCDVEHPLGLIELQLIITSCLFLPCVWSNIVTVKTLFLSCY